MAKPKQPTDLLDIVPVDHDAERWVVGSALLSASVLDSAGPLSHEDFHDPAYRAMFSAVDRMHRAGRPVDLGLVGRELVAENVSTKRDWAADIFTVASSVPVVQHCARYACLVREKSRLRRIREICMAGLSAACEGQQTPEAIVDAMEAELGKLHVVDAENDPVSIATASMEAASRIDAIHERGTNAGLPTGLYEFDTDIGGLFPGELAILAARPGVGKTSMALQIANHNASKGRLVYFASLEMSAVELSTRLACSESSVSNRSVRIGRLSDKEMSNLSNAFAQQSRANIEIHDRAFLTVAGIRREIRRRKQRGLALAVVDYLQLVTPEDRKIPREQQVARIVRELKETARECDVPILCLCQLNRQADADDVPRLSHLRESGSIEQDADVVLFLSGHKPTTDDPHNAILTIAKNRNGETGNRRLNWHPSETRFTCYEPPVHAEFADYGQASMEGF